MFLAFYFNLYGKSCMEIVVGQIILKVDVELEN